MLEKGENPDAGEGKESRCWGRERIQMLKKGENPDAGEGREPRCWRRERIQMLENYTRRKTIASLLHNEGLTIHLLSLVTAHASTLRVGYF